MIKYLGIQSDSLGSEATESDLQQFIKLCNQRLKEAGIDEDVVIVNGIDNCGHDRYYCLAPCELCKAEDIIDKTYFELQKNPSLIDWDEE